MTPSQPILVPLDGSAFSEQAIPVAATIAERWHAPLRLARVHMPRSSEVHCADGLVVMDEERDLEARRRDEAYLDRLRSGDVSTETALLQGPGVPAALAADAQASGAGLVVMTTHARRGLPRLCLGSVADALTRRSPAPVLLLHPQEVRTSSPRFQRVLVPLDDTDLARSILTHVAHVVEPKARVVLLTVLEASSWRSRAGDEGTEVPDEGERERSAIDWLESAAEPLRAAGFAVDVRVAIGRRCAEEILAAARALDADLIAMATHGRSGLARLALGSVADRVVREAEVPVLLSCPHRAPAGGSGEGH